MTNVLIKLRRTALDKDMPTKRVPEKTPRAIVHNAG
jgi:hypothetical protein